MDIVYVFQHSPHADRELQFTLRSVAANLPWIRKIWILGSHPVFLTEGRSVAQHISHEEIAWIGHWRVPVRNNFILTLMASLIPGLSDEFIWFADDYVILQPLSPDALRLRRAVERLDTIGVPGSGLYKQAIWRTKDVLERLQYPVLNFDAHLPQTYRREWVWHAYRKFQDFVSEDRYYGMLVHIAALNFAVHEYQLSHTMLGEVDRFIGIYPQYTVGLRSDDLPEDSRPPRRLRENEKVAQRLVSQETFARVCERKYFLNFNDASFLGLPERYLNERFSIPCKFER